MQTYFTDAGRQKPHIQEAERILRTCVHCGFCNATCPTYQLLGDERDGPRGRIYLMKELLESQDDDDQVTDETRLHLDRCLTCLNCETTCPSGAEYHKLLNIGRAEIERRVPRPAAERAQRYALRKMMVDPKRFQALLKLGQTFRPLVPAKLRNKMPADPVDAGARPDAHKHARQVVTWRAVYSRGFRPIPMRPPRGFLTGSASASRRSLKRAAVAPLTSTSTPKTMDERACVPISMLGGRTSNKAPKPLYKPLAVAVRLLKDMVICSRMTLITRLKRKRLAPWLKISSKSCAMNP